MRLKGTGTNALLLGVLAKQGPVQKGALKQHDVVAHAPATTVDQALHLLRKAGYIEDRIHLTAAGLRALHAAKARAT